MVIFKNNPPITCDNFGYTAKNKRDTHFCGYNLNSAYPC